jgi:hypothetical protein
MNAIVLVALKRPYTGRQVQASISLVRALGGGWSAETLPTSASRL